jgi:dihydropyrimidinase
MVCIQNGTLVTPHGLRRADLYMENGKIASVGGARVADEVFDAGGCLVFPGFIDSHTHLQMQSGRTWTADDFTSGTAAALAGGTTTILDFATQDRGGSLQTALDTWHERADGNCSCDYGFHMAVTDWNEKTRMELREMERQGVTSFKAYMAYDALRLSEGDLLALFSEAREIGFVGVHCELGDEVNRRVREALAAGHTEPQYHPLSRPSEVEGAAVRRCLELAEKAGAPVWIVHLSTKEGLCEIVNARERGQDVLVETCPQYLTLTDAVYKDNGFEAAKYVCSPPIRSPEDMAALWDALANGEIDILSTDHCSFHYKGQKELGRGDFFKIPNGLPGIEHRPALLWSAGVACGRLDPEHLAGLLSENPARAFGLYPQKGVLNVGSDADVVVWDPAYRGRIAAADMNMQVDYTPWEGFEITGQAKAVFLRGVLCAAEGRVLKPGLGRYVFRQKSL